MIIKFKMKTRSGNSLLSKYFKTPKENEANQGNEPKVNEFVHMESASPTKGLINTEYDDLQSITQNETQKRYRKRTSLRNFVLTEGTNTRKCSKDDSEDNFEVPEKKTKTRTNLKRKIYSSRNKRILSRGQQNIKTLLMQNEALFSEITSQQCRLDNFSVDEIHLALALSKSQVETHGPSHFDFADQRIENKKINLENVQNILGQYGFRPCGLEAYNSLNTAFLPGSNRRGKNKWINKFTALTIRNSKLQAKKVQSKIDFLMNQEWNGKQLSLSKTHSESYSLFSYNLQKLNPSKAIIKAFENEDRLSREDFYVENLFDVIHVQAGYLLKNWHAVEGRELSPRRTNQGQNKSNEFEKFMNQSFINLEEHFKVKKDAFPLSLIKIRTDNEKCSCRTSITDNLKNYNNNENVVQNNMECIEQNHVLSEHDTPVINNISIVQDDQKYSSAHNNIKQDYLSLSQNSSESFATIPKGVRIQSPNIFASSEDELEGVDIPKMASCNEYEKLNAYKEIVSPLNNIRSTENLNTLSVISSILDLTQELPLEHVCMYNGSFKASMDNMKPNDFLENTDWGTFKENSFNRCENLIVPSVISSIIDLTQELPLEHVLTEGESFKVLKDNIKPNDFPENTDWNTIKENSFNRSENATNARNLDNLNKSATSSELVLSTEEVNNDREDSSEDCIVLSEDEINYSIWRADMNNFGPESPNSSLNEDDEDLVQDPCVVLSTSALADRSTELLEYGILDNISEPLTQPSEIMSSPTHQPELKGALSTTLLAPVGLDGLLNGNINFNKSKQKGTTLDVQSYTRPSELSEYPPDEYEISGRIYTIRIVTDPKPEFMQKSESEILKQLYEFGIKPLKRKQAVKLLEFIYNSTHPLILKQTPIQKNYRFPDKSDKGPSNQIISHANKLNLKDCFGSQIQLLKNELQLGLDCEDYVFQTNVTKKTSRPLLPLHIAWYNLVSSSISLNETILAYQPIDLQEIHVFFKEIGYRFEPKDIKAFLDKRCIIFRYDMTQPDRQVERHIRKHKKKY
nr:structure-specific endonuclease subunit SLX4 isoform X2 [Bactrocera oleae]